MWPLPIWGGLCNAAYPVAIICMILTQNLIKPIFRINIKKEEEQLEAEA